MSKLQALLANTPLKLVMFDLDGTLVDSVADLHAALERMYRDLNMAAASEPQVRAWVGNGAQVLVQRALAYSLDEAQGAAHPRFAEAYALFQQHYAEVNGQHSQCYEGAHELLASLREQGIKVAIVTNKPLHYTTPLLAAKGLQADFVLGGDCLSEKKPSPMPLLHCLAHFDCSAEQAVMVGDSRNDVLAAQAAKVVCAAVSYGYNHGEDISLSKPDLLVDSLTQLR